MKTKTEPDYLGLQVFTQMSLEESQASGDLECGKIFGDLHSLVCEAKTRSEIRLDALEEWITAKEIEKTKEELDESATGEILLIATALRVMSESTKEYADDLRGDEMYLRAEDADSRSGQYAEAYRQIIKIFE